MTKIFDKKYYQFPIRVVLAVLPISLDTIINTTNLGLGYISGIANILSIILRITTPNSQGY
jgi:hypothetical protein